MPSRTCAETRSCESPTINPKPGPLTAGIARINDDMANASVSNPKALEGLTPARAKTQADLDAAEAASVAAEEALAEAA